jgi:hypothetical protein
MRDFSKSYAREAHYCRQQARKFEGKPEQPFLLRVAGEFENLLRHPVGRAVSAAPQQKQRKTR